MTDAARKRMEVAEADLLQKLRSAGGATIAVRLAIEELVTAALAAGVEAERMRPACAEKRKKAED